MTWKDHGAEVSRPHLNECRPGASGWEGVAFVVIVPGAVDCYLLAAKAAFIHFKLVDNTIFMSLVEQLPGMSPSFSVWFSFQFSNHLAVNFPLPIHLADFSYSLLCHGYVTPRDSVTPKSLSSLALVIFRRPDSSEKVIWIFTVPYLVPTPKEQFHLCRSL